ncbi:MULTISPECIES: acyl-CoA dehydrogenase family protein [Burkholderia]|uniref:acyl-CoA dehydrogenase family protein n=1 Tax=Burkholderia TaxID=32008 RepID=UPI0004D370D0|nr:MULTISPECIES: acyl-CoA dehydrogenase family protein [Burkholderia]KER72370.1 acyl-CoA dehydrogenase [Burkholderia cepacia]
MNVSDYSGSLLDSSWPTDRIIADVTAIADKQLAEVAHRIDHDGFYPLHIMASLGAVGAFGAHLTCGGDRIALSIDAMRAISRRCGSTGFMTWCHDVCGLYMEQSGNPALTGELLREHMMGRSFGGTALSNPMKALAGIEKMSLRAVAVPGGYRVSGALPWVSHIAPGHHFGAMAGVYRDDGSLSHEIMFLVRCTDQVHLRQCPEFSGMEGTSTWGVRVDELFVGDDMLIADPARPFIARIRAVFVLLQVGMALGVSQGSIDSMREVEPVLGHVNRFLHDRPNDLEAEYAELAEQVAMLAQTPYDGSKDYFMSVLDARAQGAELALRASQSALLHQGARGYLSSAAPQRRVREAHFVAIVTPAIKHLRWEMDRLSREEMPV